MNWDEYKRAIAENKLFEHIDATYQWGISNTEDWESAIPNNFCVAPFVNMTITSEGTNRPCCKYDAFKSEDSSDTVANTSLIKLYNSDEIESLREQFMNNERPDKCKVCWLEEDNNIKSLRQLYNHNWINKPSWGKPPEPKKINFAQAFYGQPTNLDLKLSNLCNLRCRICGPWSSTQWIKDYNNLGWADKRAIKVWTENAKEKLLVSDENKQILMNWAERILRIEFFGGEPMMQQEHHDVLDLMINSGSSEKQALCYNTNGTIFNQDIVEKWLNFDFIVVNFSIDDIGQRFEYQRKNAVYQEVLSNLENYKLLSSLYNFKHKFFIYITVSIYNVYYLKEIIDELSYLEFPFILNILHHPQDLSILNIPTSIKKIITQKLADVNHVNYHTQTIKINDIVEFMNSKEYDEKEWIKFCNYNTKIDGLRDEKFKNIFPEFYELILDEIPRIL
jgi:MoaA/NifB/PqqE/SkfB family radical SAM enzyme